MKLYKAKMMYCCINNLVQAQDNNANGIHAKAFTCYSWWLPPPRQLGAARIVERRLVIVSGSDRGDCEGSCAFPGRAPKGNSSGLLMSLSYLTCG